MQDRARHRGALYRRSSSTTPRCRTAPHTVQVNILVSGSSAGMHPTLAQVFVVDAHTPEGEHIVPALPWNSLDKKAVDTVRVLAADAVQKAGHGHPGTAMSLAPAAYLLFQNLLRHDPSDPHWVGRDRFILSPGHSSLTLYLQLYPVSYTHLTLPTKRIV